METETKPLWTTTREAMGKTWRVELWPNDNGLGETQGSAYMGKERHIDQRILVNAKAPPDGRDETLLHEILHVAVDGQAAKFNEDEVLRLSGVLYAFLRGFGLWQEFPWPDKEGSS